LLVAAFEERGCDIFIDEADIPAASEWRNEIKDGIKGSDNVVFILTRTFVESKECLAELNHAIACGKRLIPVAHEECENVPAVLAARQYIWMRDTDDFDAAFELLFLAVTTDFEVTRQHSRLMLRHEDWETNGHHIGYLLRGAELTAAEHWIERTNEIIEPKPTAPLIRYIIASRKSATRRRSLFVLAAIFGLLLAVTALWTYQRERAQTVARHIADTYQWMRRDPLRAIDSAVAALVIDDSPEAKAALSSAQRIAAARIENLRDEATIEGRPGLVGIGVMRWRTGDIYSRIRTDGRYALIASKRGEDGASGGAGKVYLIDLNSMRTLELLNSDTTRHRLDPEASSFHDTTRRRLEYMGFSSDGEHIFVTRQFWLDVYELDGTLIFTRELGQTAQPLHIAAGYFKKTSILVCDSEGEMWFVDTATGKTSRWYGQNPAGKEPAILVEPSGSGHRAIVVFESGAVFLLTVKDSAKPTMTPLDAADVTFANFQEAYSRFATADKTGNIKVWQLIAGEPELIASFQQDGASGLIKFSDDGKRLLSVAEDGSIRIWVIRSKEVLFRNGPVAQ